jgi:hypothetical protein
MQKTKPSKILTSGSSHDYDGYKEERKEKTKEKVKISE